MKQISNVCIKMLKYKFRNYYWLLIYFFIKSAFLINNLKSLLKMKFKKRCKYIIFLKQQC